jgi:NADP-dependent 3-hydroxy acid dehydrogenase YdfG
VSGSLASSTAVVTGASRGIGLAITRALAGEGARVAMIARSAGVLSGLARELAPNAIAVPCDLTNDAALTEAAARCRDGLAGAPDILVQAAGTFTLAPLHELATAEFAAALDVNLTAPFRVLRAFLPAMRARGRGHIVTIGSVADRTTFPDNGAYAASKFGLRALHEVLRAETRGTGVRASLVSPAAVDTPLWDAIDPDARAGFTPRQAMLVADDVARAVVFILTQPPRVNVDELRLSS